MFVVYCLGRDGKIRKEVFENKKDAEQVAKIINDFYGMMAKVVEKNDQTTRL